jgi:hypothetical protein
MDASTRKDTKIVSIVVRHFLLLQGVKVKLLGFKSVPGETEILSSTLVLVIKKHELEHKVIGLCADNCNSNFGGVKRRDENSVYSRLKKEFHREIVGVGCAAYIVHNFLQTAVDVLPIDIEVLVAKLNKYFHICTVHVTQLKSLCDFISVEYKKLLQHENMRFLPFFLPLEGFLRCFPRLNSCFCSQEQCQTVVKKFFDNPCGKMYLQFVCGQLHLFNHKILKPEKTIITATEVAWELEKIK